MIDKGYNENNEVIFTSQGLPVFDPENDYDESRELDKEETEYDDEGYPVAKWIPSLKDSLTTKQILEEEKEQRKVTMLVILGCVALMTICFGLAFLIVKP